MRYVDQVLQRGERITYQTQIRRAAYIPGATLLAICILALALSGRHLATVAPYATGGVLIGLFSLVRIFIQIRTTEIVITDRRIILKTGLISRRTIEMNTDKVESVDVRQDPIARLLNYGDIIVRGTGSGIEPVKAVDNPLEFRRRIFG
jgi:uncharacterized membrane protein YdbT with pleckstrin-like domain